MIGEISILQQIGPIFLLAIISLFLMGITYLAIQTFEFSGFTSLESILIIISPLLGQYIPSNLQNLIIVQIGNIHFGINLFGFFIPVLISFRIIYQGRIDKKKALVGISLISILSYSLSSYVPASGIFVSSFYVIPFTASIISIILDPFNLRKIAPLAYVSGSFGVLIGADLLRINEILAYEPIRPIGMIIGGAGALDAIFLVGILSIIVDLLLIFLNPECRREFKDEGFFP